MVSPTTLRETLETPAVHTSCLHKVASSAVVKISAALCGRGNTGWMFRLCWLVYIFGANSFIFLDRQNQTIFPHISSKPPSPILLIFHCPIVMTAFLAYQPQRNAPSFGGRIFRKSPAVGLPSSPSSGQSTKSPQQATSVSNADFVDFMDLTGPRLAAAREYLVAREILEPINHDSDKGGIQASRARRSNATDNDKFDHGEGDGDDDTDFESDTSDLPSLRDLFAWDDKQSIRRNALNLEASASPTSVVRISKERCSEGDSEGSVYPDNPPNSPPVVTLTSACSTQLGASQGE